MYNSMFRMKNQPRTEHELAATYRKGKLTLLVTHWPWYTVIFGSLLLALKKNVFNSSKCNLNSEKPCVAKN